MESIDEFIDPRPKNFHPAKEINETDWYPSTEITSLLLQTDIVWGDLICISKMYHSEESDYSKKLLLKYIVIELRSLMKLVDKLQGGVMKAPIFDPKDKQGWRELTHDEHNKARELFKLYKEAKTQAESDIIKIRNEIGAHRGNINWREVKEFWGKMEPELVDPVLTSIHDVIDYVRTLDLFDWSRTTERGTRQLTGAVLRPEHFE